MNKVKQILNNYVTKSCCDKKINTNNFEQTLILVGSPNVGKSSLFNLLTGSRVIVSNYPGTTVELSEGYMSINDKSYKVIDTPGMYSMYCITEEEKVARDIIINNHEAIIINVIDAKNIDRMLPFTLQMIEAGLSIILVLNIMDEADKLGITINIKKLEHKLNIPVVPTVSITGSGIEQLKHRISEYLHTEHLRLDYGETINTNAHNIKHLMQGNYAIDKYMIALLAIQQDNDILKRIESQEKQNYNKILEYINRTKNEYKEPLNYIINLKRVKYIKQIMKDITTIDEKIQKNKFKSFLDFITMNPITGIPVLILIIYFGLYKFVGEFGAGEIVDFLENTIFGNYINPYITNFIEKIIHWKILQDLFVHEYGIITLGIRYAFAIVLPVVGTFFIVFSIIEDSGYLPRLAMLLDKFFKKIGLSGRAVIPMVLGLGCDTMGTIVTRILPTKRERFIATFLLSLTIPCSAQIGVILGLFDNKLIEFVIWLSVILLIFIISGTIMSKFVPGKKAVFFMELPPLRLPKISNVLVKTISRMEWYFKEILPIFIFASIMIWAGKITKLFDLFIKILEYPVSWMGLPLESAKIFLYGFFRRDFGAAGLYDLKKAHLMNDNQLLISAIVLTLFVPCIAQLLITIKEQGKKKGLLISASIFFFSIIIGIILNLIFKGFGIVL